ncbi:MAG: hypothetical protein ACTSQE_15485, partial [Candidatus Heimdallarchaeaceae archaeon]
MLSHAISGYASLLVKAINEANVAPPSTTLVLKSFIEALKIPIYWILRKLDKSEKKKITKAIETEFKQTGKVFNALSNDDRTIVSEYKKAKEKNPTWVDHPKLEKKKAPSISVKKVTRQKKEVKQEAKKELKKEPKRKTTKVEKTKEKEPRYYLKLEDEIEKAPEIGKRTAERLQKVGIKTVKDLLNANPNNLASKINARHIKVTDI